MLLGKVQKIVLIKCEISDQLWKIAMIEQQYQLTSISLMIIAS